MVLVPQVRLRFQSEQKRFRQADGNFVVQTDNGVLNFFFCGEVVFHSQLDIGLSWAGWASLAFAA